MPIDSNPWIVLLGGLVAGFFIRNFFPDYFSEKGKNLATKEDIAEITELVEGAKLESTTQVEELRAELTHATYVSRVQFEKEFSIYSDVWDALVEVRDAVLSLRPWMDSWPEDKDARKKMQQDRMNLFADTFESFGKLAEKQKPFYADSIYAEIGALRKTMKREFIEYRYSDGDREKDYWENAEKNAAKIVEQSDRICEAIRNRVRDLRVT